MKRPGALTRRQALAGIAASLAGGSAAGARAAVPESGATTTFAHGVASGDPSATSVVLWTRVSGVRGALSGRWQVAGDARFASIVSAGGFTTTADRDHTVKVVAEGLQPGRQYFYRFHADGQQSPVGRTRTLPRGMIDSVGFAIASCSNLPFGHFNGYDAIARDPQVEFVLHLGDYLYEYGVDGYGGTVGAQLKRDHEPRHEIVSLADYRTRHAQYKRDAASQLMHGAHPLIPIWDDHESANNPWMGGAENHQPAEEGDWAQRRTASLQAYYEWMPIREPTAGGNRADYWRYLSFGELAGLISLETRHTGRSEQIDYARHLPEIRNADDAARFQRNVLGAEGRAMLAEPMERFLADSVGNSVGRGQTWRLVANQIPMARVHVPPLDERFATGAADPADPTSGHKRHLQTLGRFDLPLYLDTWDGYPGARERFYRICADQGASDLLVLTGDSHSFWQNELRSATGEPRGVEIGTTSITSPGDFAGFGTDDAQRMDRLLAEHNREVVWTDNTHRGYVRLLLSGGTARVDYVAVDRIDIPDYRVDVLRTVVVTRRDGRLHYRVEPA